MIAFSQNIRKMGEVILFFGRMGSLNSGRQSNLEVDHGWKGNDEKSTRWPSRGKMGVTKSWLRHAGDSRSRGPEWPRKWPVCYTWNRQAGEVNAGANGTESPNR
jgi:hypothetical protein